jgi:methylglutaconyl-CoA hydratase
MPTLLTSSAGIDFSMSDNVGCITLQNGKVNALCGETHERLMAIFRHFSKNDEVRCVVIKSALARAFSAGLDFDWIRAIQNMEPKEGLKEYSKFSHMLIELYELSEKIQVIALVDGPVRGGAMALVSACNIVFATEKADFELSETKHGIWPYIVEPYMVHRTGQSTFNWYATRGQKFDAQKALDVNLVDYIVQSKDLNKALHDFMQTQVWTKIRTNLFFDEKDARTRAEQSFELLPNFKV